jgi:MoxR-like ATPase
MNERIKKESAFIDELLDEVSQTVVGQKGFIEKLLVGVLTGGHVLVEGLPGLAKTLAVRTFAAALKTEFKRIQFTPDLLPADVLGTLIYNPKTSEFVTRKGPIFSNIILADEINRAPAKVQSALLECMQEKQVTLGDQTFRLEEPFLVLATQNPIEHEGTYPLPEAQLDRFMMKIKVTYPDRDEERKIIELYTKGKERKTSAVINPKTLLAARETIQELYIDEKVIEYILDIVLATRNPENFGLKELKPFIAYGCSPRASLALTTASKAHAFIKHRGYVIPEDIRTIGTDVLRHRLILTYEADAEGMTTDDVIKKILDTLEVP